MMAHHRRRMENEIILIFQYSVYKDPEWLRQAQAHIAATVYLMCEVIV